MSELHCPECGSLMTPEPVTESIDPEREPMKVGTLHRCVCGVAAFVDECEVVE